MGKVMHRVFLGFVGLVLVLGIALVILGSAMTRQLNDTYSQQVQFREATLDNIAKEYTSTGVGDGLKDAVEQYLQQLPGETRQLNNIVLVDESGSILYQYNDQFLRAEATKISLFFDNSYGAIVYGLDEFDAFYFDGPNTFGNGSFGNGSMTVDTAEKIRRGLRVWSVDGEGTRNRINMVEGKLQNKNFMLLWLYNDAVSNSLYSSNNYPWGLWYGVTNIGAILIFIYWLLLPVWVFLDARRKKVQALPWALLVLVTNVVGMIVYWIVQSQNSKAPIMTGPACPACGKPVQQEHLYCPWCAEPLHTNCTQCGRPLEKGWVACPWCGKPSE